MTLAEPSFIGEFGADCFCGRGLHAGFLPPRRFIIFWRGSVGGSDFPPADSVLAAEMRLKPSFSLQEQESRVSRTIIVLRYQRSLPPFPYHTCLAIRCAKSQEVHRDVLVKLSRCLDSLPTVLGQLPRGRLQMGTRTAAWLYLPSIELMIRNSGVLPTCRVGICRSKISIVL